MRFLRNTLRLLFFMAVGVSITHHLLLYFNHVYFPPSNWITIGFIAGAPLGLLIAALPWGDNEWRGYLTGAWLLGVHIAFAGFCLMKYGTFLDLTELNYTEQLNLQAWYFFGFWVISFFTFQPWNWSWAETVQGEDDPEQRDEDPAGNGERDHLPVQGEGESG